MKHGSIEGLYMSAYPAFALLAAIQLDLFSAIAEESAGGGGTAATAGLAARLGVGESRLQALLDALVVAVAGSTRDTVDFAAPCSSGETISMLARPIRSASHGVTSLPSSAPPFL